MAYDFTAASSQSLTAFSPISQGPATLSCWFNRPNFSLNCVLVALVDTGNANKRFNLTSTTNAQVSAVENNGTSTAVTTTIATIAANTWNNACGVFASNTLRTIYLNGANSSANTENLTATTGLNGVSIGVRNNSTPTNYLNGIVAEVGIWNAALTAAEIASLAAGMTCDKVRPQSLVFYAPLVRDLIDAKGGLAITNNNTATVSTHPRVYA